MVICGSRGGSRIFRGGGSAVQHISAAGKNGVWGVGNGGAVKKYGSWGGHPLPPGTTSGFSDRNQPQFYCTVVTQ